jgi:hypothetical protein
MKTYTDYVRLRSPSETMMETKTLIPFFALSIGLTWVIAAMGILFTDQIVAIFGEISLSNPLVILAVYSPGFAGVFLVWRHYGLKVLGSFFQRLTLWRAPILWWLFILLGIPGIVYTGAAVKGTISGLFPFSLVPGAAGVGARLVPRPYRGVRLAGARPAPVAAQIRSVLGWLNPGRYLGSLAHPPFSNERDAAELLVRWALLPRHRGHFRHPDAYVQRCSGQPAARRFVPLSDDEPHIS